MGFFSFPFHYFDWIIMSKDIIWNTGREFGENIHPELKTFSVVVSSEMTPGFHIIVFAAVGTGNTKEIVAGNLHRYLMLLMLYLLDICGNVDQ